MLSDRIMNYSTKRIPHIRAIVRIISLTSTKALISTSLLIKKIYFGNIT